MDKELGEFARFYSKTLAQCQEIQRNRCCLLVGVNLMNFIEFYCSLKKILVYNRAFWYPSTVNPRLSATIGPARIMADK